MAKASDIQRRIKSINNIKKITKAMEMVAAAKMRKAIEAVLKTRTYANLSWETVLHLTNISDAQGKPLHPLLTKRKKVAKVAIILFTANRGLCGGYNTAIINKVKESIKKHHFTNDSLKVDYEFILMGKKGAVFYNQGHNIIAEFPKSELASSASEIAPIAKLIIDGYLHKKFDKVMLAYTDFINSVKQIPRIKQLLPIEIDKEDEYLGVVGKDPRIGVTKTLIEEKEKKHFQADDFSYEYLFEPGPNEVLNSIVPRLVEIQLYQALLESNASEHSARMSAMHQANQSANDMVSELVLYFNKARQASITAEIAEISSGANALGD